MNPIFIEYYSHDKCDHYKIRNPWTKYGDEVIALCRVTEGLPFAKLLAIGVLQTKLQEALQQES